MRIYISHTDLDGIGGILLAKYFNLPFDEIYSWDYGFTELPECLETLKKADEIVMSDLSIPEEVYEDLIKKGKHIEIYDHHDTASWLDKKTGSVHDESRSGTKIFFEEYVLPRIGRYKPIVREFVALVDVYDRWDLDSPLRKESENLQRVWSSYATWRCPDNLLRHDRFILQMIRKFDHYEHFNWNLTEENYIQETLQKEERSYEQAVATLKRRVDNKGRKFGVWKAWGRVSITASRLLREVGDLDYVICLQDSPDNWGKVSVRSIEGTFDVTSLASVGGHLAAGGTTVSGEEASCFWEEDMCFKYAEEWETDTSPIEKCRN